jgi:hypothetical protein
MTTERRRKEPNMQEPRQRVRNAAMNFCIPSPKTWIINSAAVDMARASVKNSHAILRRSRTVWSVKRFVGGALELMIRVNVIDPPKIDSAWIGRKRIFSQRVTGNSGGEELSPWKASAGISLRFVATSVLVILLDFGSEGAIGLDIFIVVVAIMILMVEGREYESPLLTATAILG